MPILDNIDIGSRTASISRAGGRRENEDCCDFAAVGGIACWVVADGLGGHSAGQIASELVVGAVLESFRANPACSSAAAMTYVAAAQAELARTKRANPSVEDMRSTAALMISDGHRFVVAHTGDSRLYCFDDGGLAFRTENHSLPRPAPGNDQHAGRRSSRVHLVLRALGDDSQWRPTVTEPRPLCRGSAVLLCTDGFWDHVTETEMMVDLAKADDPADWLTHLEARLLERAAADCDNYTAVAVLFPFTTAPPEPRLEYASPRSRRIRTALAVAILAACIIAIVLFAADRGILGDLPKSLLRGDRRVDPPKPPQPAGRVPRTP